MRQLILYVIIAVAMWYFKSELFFDKNTHKLKEFGLENNKTIFYYPLVVVFLAIVLFYIFEILNLKKNKII